MGVTATLSAGDAELPEDGGLDQFSATLTPAEGDVSTVEFTAGEDGESRASGQTATVAWVIESFEVDEADDNGDEE